ncbi:ribosomal L10 family protein [Candidatus Endolissoclinum faulkneri L2]|uniref:Large ribosomal subunit protein uL10 n=1 Tax=Candidatus Endolissoclinum faulkneri L2 TaxID=1193729 RepID=K7ZCC6_9PROT|nr:50S ribosomal protein L10 [Candidatus Endolissoclinum faulkneri]AFX98446.1 ribosomal L10 family protein [Candidatus Endolissoclinum faulkneri L2]
MNRTKKSELIKSIHSTFKCADVLVITHHAHLTVKEIEDLRAKIRAVGGCYKVVKNRLARLALLDTRYANLRHLLTGPTSLTISKNPIPAIKVIVEFANKNEKITIIGGGLGEQVLDTNEIYVLSTTPSIEESRNNITSVLRNVPRKIVTIIGAPASKITRVLRFHSISDS